MLFSLAAVPLLALSTVSATSVLSSSQAAAELNAEFTGSSGNTGTDAVFLRDLGSNMWEEFCGKGCYRGTPDCRMSASFYSLQSDVNRSTNFFFGRTMLGEDIGVAFNSTLVRNSLARCYYITDGASTARYNGGCGCMATSENKNCDSEFSPYRNNAPPPYHGKAYGGTQFGDKCLCTDPNSSETDQPGHATHDHASCFWRGPALKVGDHRVWNGSEFDKAVAQRHRFPFSDYDITTHGQIYRKWTEVVLDSGLVHEAMVHDPGATAWAVYYNDPPKFGVPVERVIALAKKLQAQLQALYHVKLPIVRLAMQERVSVEKGPFHEHPENAVADNLIAV